jgi:hypothetical protein
MLDPAKAEWHQFDPWYDERMTAWEARPWWLRIYHAITGENFWTFR